MVKIFFFIYQEIEFPLKQLVTVASHDVNVYSCKDCTLVFFITDFKVLKDNY